jgi:hypothetical protein
MSEILISDEDQITSFYILAQKLLDEQPYLKTLKKPQEMFELDIEKNKKLFTDNQILKHRFNILVGEGKPYKEVKEEIDRAANKELQG